MGQKTNVDASVEKQPRPRIFKFLQTTDTFRSVCFIRTISTFLRYVYYVYEESDEGEEDARDTGDVGTFPSCVCDDKSRYFTTKHDAFLNITKWFFCLNLPMDSHLSLSIYSGRSRCCNQLIELSFAGRNKNGDVIFLRSEQSGSFMTRLS